MPLRGVFPRPVLLGLALSLLLASCFTPEPIPTLVGETVAPPPSSWGMCPSRDPSRHMSPAYGTTPMGNAFGPTPPSLSAPRIATRMPSTTALLSPMGLHFSQGK